MIPARVAAREVASHCSLPKAAGTVTTACRISSGVWRRTAEVHNSSAVSLFLLLVVTYVPASSAKRKALFQMVRKGETGKPLC
jgi:hypothetical protein